MPSSASKIFEFWNRRLHYYLGLYFLFFLWLFAFTGLLLNHSTWHFAQYWPERVETSYERPIEPLSGSDDVARAKEVMRELGLEGEIDWPNQSPAQGRLEFAVNRPGTLNRVSFDTAGGLATVQNIRTNTWGVMNVLHTFSGTRSTSPTARRDWILTSVWVLAMDALAAGLLAMVFGSYFMWYRLKQKRTWGWVSLATGTLVCGLFVLGLAWLG